MNFVKEGVDDLITEIARFIMEALPDSEFLVYDIVLLPEDVYFATKEDLAKFEPTTELVCTKEHEKKLYSGYCLIYKEHIKKVRDEYRGLPQAFLPFSIKRKWISFCKRAQVIYDGTICKETSDQSLVGVFYCHKRNYRYAYSCLIQLLPGALFAACLVSPTENRPYEVQIRVALTCSAVGRFVNSPCFSADPIIQ